MGCKATQTNLEDSYFDKEKNRVLDKEKAYVDAEPITVTAGTCERSTGNKNDFYSEGDY